MLKIKTLIVTMLIVFNLLELPSFAFNYNDNLNYSYNNQNSGFNINLLKIDFSGNSFNMSNTFNVNSTFNPELKTENDLIAQVSIELLSSVVLGFALSFSFLFMSIATKLDSFWSFLIVSTAFIVGVSLGTSLSGDFLGINSSFSNALGGTLIGLIASFALLESAVFATDNPNNQVGKIYFNIMAVVALIVPSIFSVVFYNSYKKTARY